MNLLERKSDFDAKVNSFMALTGNAMVFNKPELYYELYLKDKYGDNFKDFTYSNERNYVIINFNNQIDKTNGKDK